MIEAMNIIEWFEDSPLPDLYPVPAVILGGKSLLREFVSTVARWNSRGILSIATPYVSSAAFSSTGDWSLLNHKKIDVRFVTASESARDCVASELGGYPWADFGLRVSQDLHAKIYTFTDIDGRGVCLVGSHNLSRAAVEVNDEAGMLYASCEPDGIGKVVKTWQKRISSIFWGRQDVSTVEYSASNLIEIKIKKAG